MGKEDDFLWNLMGKDEKMMIFMIFCKFLSGMLGTFKPEDLILR